MKRMIGLLLIICMVGCEGKEGLIGPQGKDGLIGPQGEQGQKRGGIRRGFGATSTISRHSTITMSGYRIGWRRGDVEEPRLR